MKKLLSLILVLVLVLTIFPFSNIVVYAANSGACGEHVIWEYDENTGTLVISGNGEIHNYNTYQSFDRNYNRIETIIVKEGITGIGDYFFGLCENATSISIPISVTKINKCAFEKCSSLKNVYYAGTEEQWNKINISMDGNDHLNNAKINYKQDEHICYFGNWEIVNEASCVSAGIKIRKCSCGKDESESIPVTGVHNFEWKISKEATCTENGEEKHICTVCNTIDENRIINKLGHIKGDWETVKESTCTDAGLKVKKCTFCGVVLEEDTIAQLQHDFSEWKTTIKETEERNGEESRKCKSCSYTETRVVDNIQPSKKELIGDANNDGYVTAKDARLVLQVVAGLKNKTDLVINNADVNNDNQISATDARKILQIVAGLE